jgi:hypothetical protein
MTMRRMPEKGSYGRTYDKRYALTTKKELLGNKKPVVSLGFIYQYYRLRPDGVYWTEL